MQSFQIITWPAFKSQFHDRARINMSRGTSGCWPATVPRYRRFDLSNGPFVQMSMLALGAREVDQAGILLL